MTVSIRGLQEGGQRAGYPLIKFTGDFDGYYDQEDKFGNTQVYLQFSNLNVAESAEPYPYNTIELPVKYSNYKHSVWGILSDSLGKFLGDEEDIDDAVGETMTLTFSEGHELPFKDKNWQPEVDDDGNPLNEDERPNVVISAWEIVGVNGRTAGSAGLDPMDRLGELLDGKNRAGFNKAAMTDPVVKAQGKEFVTAQITKKGFITSVLEDGSFEEDEDGVFHAVA